MKRLLPKTIRLSQSYHLSL